MPNRKIKHIVAKLVGASTEETLDVYDVDAVHTDKIYNGLDQTTAGYVLDARQGKALNDSLTRLDWYGLTGASGTQATTTLTTHTTMLSRAFSDYDMLDFVVMDVNKGYVRVGTFTPTSVFTNTPISLTWVNSSNQQYWVEITYASDTSYKIQTGSSGTGSWVFIYGIKLKSALNG